MILQLTLVLGLVVPVRADLSTITIFTHGERADCICIRGPRLLLAASRSSSTAATSSSSTTSSAATAPPTLVAFADCVPAVGDNCQPVRPTKVLPGAVHRLIYKRSRDGGATWGPLTNAPGVGGSPVVLHNGSLLLLADRTLWRSDDGAGTWHIATANVTGAGGAMMIQLSATHSHPGRLVAVRKGPGSVGQKAALTSYSDDLGATWHSSRTQQEHMDESELLELADGT
eukprot:SAG25_NODE_4749_length_756_cov_0.864536_1_plen_228_part_01